MTTRFVLPHVDISALQTNGAYTAHSSVGSSNPRIRAEHGARLLREYNAALAMIDEMREVDSPLERAAGGYIEVELKKSANPLSVLERKRDGIRPSATRDIDNSRVVALFVPDNAREAFSQILSDYHQGPLTDKGNAPNAARVEPIEAFRRAHLGTFWTDDPDFLPEAPHQTIWWAVWVHSDNEAALDRICRRLEVRAAPRDGRLYFPEATVVPVFATRAAIELMTFVGGIVDELRRATDNPVFFNCLSPSLSHILHVGRKRAAGRGQAAARQAFGIGRTEGRSAAASA